MLESSGLRLRLVYRSTRRRAKQVVAAALCVASFLTGQLLFGADSAPLVVLNPYLQPNDEAAGREPGASGQEPGDSSQRIGNWGRGMGVMPSARRGAGSTFQPAAIEPIESPTLPSRRPMPAIISPADARPLQAFARPIAVVDDEDAQDEAGDDEVRDDQTSLSRPAEPLWIENTTISPKLARLRPLEWESPIPAEKSPAQKSSRTPRRARLSISDDEASLPSVLPAVALPGPAGGESGIGRRQSGVRTAAAPWMEDIRSALNPR